MTAVVRQTANQEELTTMATFPENEVEICKEDTPRALGETQSQKIQEVRNSLSDILAGIQIAHPRNKRRLTENAAALERNDARSDLVNSSFFKKVLGDRLDKFNTVYGHLRKHEFGLALIALSKIVPEKALPGITIPILEEAFATTTLPYYEFILKDIGPSENEDRGIQHTLKGYRGIILDVHVIHQLVFGGPELDFRLHLLKAECDFGKRDIESIKLAIKEYATLLPKLKIIPINVFGTQLNLFEEFLPPVSFPLIPRQRFVAIRSAFAYLALGDRLFRRQRTLSDQDRQGVSSVYDAAVRLVEKSGVSADNPRRREIEAHASLQKGKLQNRLNYLGLWDAFVPVQRYSQLEQSAISQIASAKTTADDFFGFLNSAEAALEQQMDVQFQQDQESDSLDILNIRQNNTTLSVDKIDEQISAINDQRDSLLAQSVVGGLRAIVEGTVTKKQTTGPLGFATAAVGVAGTVVNFFAQANELAHQLRIAEIEKEIAENEVNIAALERNSSADRIAFYEQKLDFLGNKRLNADLLYTLAELNEKRAERQLDVAIYLAYLYERALAFFLGEPNIRHIQFDYIDRPGGIFDAASALKEDFVLVTNESNNIDKEKPDDFREHISLRGSYPIQFSRFLKTGKMDFVYSLYQLSKRRPDSHQCRLYAVGVEIQGLVPATGFSGTLTHSGRFLVRDKATTLDPEVTRLLPTDDQIVQALEKQRREGLPVAAVGGVLCYDLDRDTKELSQDTQFITDLPPEQITLKVFEGRGPTGLWNLVIKQHGELAITDVLLHFGIVERESDTASLGPKVEQMIRLYEAELADGDLLDRISVFSLRQNFPDTFFAMQTGLATFVLNEENFPNGLTNLQFKTVIVQALDQAEKALPGVAIEITRQEFGFSQVRMTRPDGFSEDLDVPLQMLARDQRFPIMGTWQIRLSDPSQFAQLGDLRLFFMYAFEEL